jgi:hypothetical protein
MYFYTFAVLIKNQEKGDKLINGQKTRSRKGVNR